MVDRLIVWLEAYNWKRENIVFISYDFGAAYLSGVCRNFLNIRIVYDEFHAMKLIVEAMDNTARQAIKARHLMRMKVSKLSGE